MKVGCQLIIFGRDTVKEDLAGVLATVAEAGYDGVETGDLSEHIGPEALRRELASRGLVLVGTHAGFDACRSDADRLADYTLQAGGRYLMCSGVGDRSRGLAAYEEAAAVMNEVGERVARKGLVFCYHNHSWEFERFEGRPALERLYELTDPEVVKLCVDTCWVYHGGEDPAEFIRRHRDRVAVLHLKDLVGEPGTGPVTFAEVGEGVLDFASILEAVEGADVEWAVVEQDRTSRSPAESVRMSRRYLKEHLGL